MKNENKIEYIKNYLKYYEKNIKDIETSLIFFMIRLKIEEIEKLNEKQIKILNETMIKQMEE